PLGLATLAALCPPDWEVTIVDENVESLPLAGDSSVCNLGRPRAAAAPTSLLPLTVRTAG
ncbi:MAG: hypothetical protein ACK6C0_16775, partial [Betaproteobacteria bacterium]